MTIGQRFKMLRNQLGLSQKAVGAQGFISTQGWIKIEHGKRAPSDKLLLELIGWLLKDDYFTLTVAEELLEELLTLKYLESPSPFLRKLARANAKPAFSAGSIGLLDHSGARTARWNLKEPRPLKSRSRPMKGVH